MLGSVHESTQRPESCLKFNKNAVTYATLTRRKRRPSNPEAESRGKVCNSCISYTTYSPDAPFVVKAAELYERMEAKQIVLLHNEA